MVRCFHTDERGRRNRRAPGALAGGKHGGDGRLRPETTGFPPVVGDRKIADVSAVNLGNAASRRLSASICVICGHCDGRATLRWLRVFVSSCLRCLALCFSLCLCASVVQPVVGGLRARFQIHLREQRVERHCRFELGERYLVVDGVRVELIGRTKTDGRDAENARSGASVR